MSSIDILPVFIADIFNGVGIVSIKEMCSGYIFFDIIKEVLKIDASWNLKKD
jgi:hypothetical protein